MKTVIIIQARMTSTRLPGKVLKKVLNKPLLEIQLERLKQVTNADEIVIATTENKTDDPIIDLCNRLSISFYRGSEDDVLARYYQAAKAYNAEVVVRITSDCPIIDPKVVELVIENYLVDERNIDYASNSLIRTYPRGMDTEIFSFFALERTYNEAKTIPEREHVTPYIYNNPKLFKIENIAYHRDMSQHRWTVDTIEDFHLIKNIIEELYPKNPMFTLEEALVIMEQNPEWFSINNFIEQKKLGNRLNT